MLVACTPTKLLKATADYATLTQITASELHDAPGVLTQLCRDRLEIEYMTERLIPGEVAGSLQDFVDQPFTSASGNISLSWKLRCASLRRAEDAFDRGLSAIEKYGRALGAFAGRDLTPEADIRSLASATAADATTLSEDAKPYHAAIDGLGAPLADLAHALEGKWKRHALAPLIVRTDQPLRTAIHQLDEFIRVVRKRQLVDARVALHELVTVLDRKDVMMNVFVSRLDIEMTDHFDQLDAKLRAMTAALDSLAAAHAKLADGWNKGEDAGLATLVAIATSARDIYADMKAFQNPSVGGAP